MLIFSRTPFSRKRLKNICCFSFVEGAAQKWVKLKKTLKNERNAFIVAFSKTKEEKNKIRIAQVKILRSQNRHFIKKPRLKFGPLPKMVRPPSFGQYTNLFIFHEEHAL